MTRPAKILARPTPRARSSAAGATSLSAGSSAATRGPDPAATLRELESLRTRFGPKASRAKLSLLRTLERRELGRASEVLRFHDLLCFWRAYPDGRALLRQVERMLRDFAGRADLGRHAERLADSGIAGTEIRFR